MLNVSHIPNPTGGKISTVFILKELLGQTKIQAEVNKEENFKREMGIVFQLIRLKKKRLKAG